MRHSRERRSSQRNHHIERRRTGHRLGVEDIHSPEGKLNSVDFLSPSWWPRLCRWSGSPLPYPAAGAKEDQGPVSWRPTTVKLRQFSQSNRHSIIGTRQIEYHEALLSSVNVQLHLTSSFADDGNASWYSVCRVPMVEWRLDCKNCRHLTVVGLHDTGPRIVADNSAHPGLKVHGGKSKVLKNDAGVSTTPTTLNGDALEDESSSTYLGSLADRQDGTDFDIKVRISRARAAFLQMKNIWASPNLTINIKISIFKTCSAVWSWNIVKHGIVTAKMIQSFVKTCLRRILRIR